MMKIAVLILTITYYYATSVCAQVPTIQEDEYLMIIDVQERAGSKKDFDNDMLQLVERINEVSNQYKPRHIIYVKNAQRALQISLKGFSIDTLSVKDLHTHLALLSENVFVKYSASAFDSEALQNFLAARDVERICLVGRATSQCVYATALAGRELGYEISIIPELTWDKSDRKKRRVLRKMQQNGISVRHVETVSQ